MKTVLRLALLLLPLAGLAACATTDDQRAASMPHPSLQTQDHQYVSRVEEVARKRGVRVAWINPPMNRDDTVLATQD